MRKLFAIACIAWGTSAFALEGLYLGAQVGQVGLTGISGRSNAIGFGVDVGVKTVGLLDLVFHLNYSNHSGGGGLRILAPQLSALYHVTQTGELDISVEGGPGFYSFSSTATETKFGIQLGINADVILEEHLRAGLGWRYHNPFDATLGGSFYTLMMRVGWLFE